MKLYLKSKVIDIRGKFSRAVDKFFPKDDEENESQTVSDGSTYMDEDIRQKVMLNKTTNHK